MLEKFLINPGVLTDDQVMEILKSAFRRDEVTALIHSFLRENIGGRKRRRWDAESLTLDKGRNYTPLSVLTAF